MSADAISEISNFTDPICMLLSALNMWGEAELPLA